MGLLDSVLGQVLGDTQPHPQDGQVGSMGGPAGLGDLGGFAGALGGLLANNGEHRRFGWPGVEVRASRDGRRDRSWIGSGDNVPVSGDQLQAALGGDAISSIAQKLGIDVAMLLPMLATLLPRLIDQLTPKGQAPAEGLGNQDDLLSSLSGLLQKG